MPKLADSEIFELFNKQAEEAGLLPKLQDDGKGKPETSAMKKYKSETNPRMGSDDISTIEALYGIKPDGQDYDWNIVEEAHPNTIIVAPSYDKINGLFENVNQRQSIIMNRVLKPTNGISENTKYAAKKELIGELVRTANYLDNINEDSLAVQVDKILSLLK